MAGVDIGGLGARSVTLISQHQAATGAYVASPTFAPYRYSWFRDGAFVANAMSDCGQVESAEAFFAWCARALVTRRDQVESLIAKAEAGAAVPAEHHLHTRYTLDGAESDEPWWNFQLDGYGTWLWALDAHSRRHGRPRGPWAEGAELTARYLSAFWDQPSYDWWEEHPEHRHTSTLAAIHGGLRAAASFEELSGSTREEAARAADAIAQVVAADGVRGGRLVKWLGGDGLDASLVACSTPFRLYAPDDPVMTATTAAIERDLVTGGVYRYPQDTYYGGGEWVLLAGFLGWHHTEAGNPERARELLAWMAAQADGDGHLPEQVAGRLLQPSRQAEWVRHWGPSAKPLLWSHAMLLTLARALGALDVPVRGDTR